MSEDTKVYEGEMITVRFLAEVPYTDEDGNQIGLTEIGATSVVPKDLGDNWIADGAAELVENSEAIIADEEESSKDIEDKNILDVESDIETPKDVIMSWYGDNIVAGIEDVILQGKTYKKFSTDKGSNFIVSEEDFNNNVVNQ